jgi:hypothetical protein
MAQSGLPKKLLIKPGYKVALLNAPPAYSAQLGELPDGVTLAQDTEGQPYDVVHLFAYTKAAVDQYGLAAIHAVKPGGVLWISYRKSVPKGEVRSVHRDVGWETIYQAGWEGVSLIAIDEVWAAMRFRPSAEIKSTSAGRAKRADTLKGGPKEMLFQQKAD